MRLTISLLFAALLLPVAVMAKDLVLTSPLRESASKAQEVFQPIAEYLSRVLGQPVVFKYSDNWLSYQSEMQKDVYDIVFDGPHFVSWRLAKLQHVPMVKLPSQLSFVIVARKDNLKLNGLSDLNGRSLCTPAPPNLGALIVLYEFTNPARQPQLKNTAGFPQAYEAMITKKCLAAVMQIKIFEKLDKDKQLAKILFQSKGMPNQAFTASPRINDALRKRIVEALLSEQGKQATKKLRDEYNGQDFVPTTAEEYRDIHLLLKDVWGFQI